MTKIDIFGIPLKKSSELDVLKPLKNLITSRYQSAEQESYIAAINEFSKLRTSAVCRTLDFHDKSLELLYKYYDQLNALESKIPQNELQIPFKWKDAFDKGSLFGGRVSLTLSSIAYERVCTLFNVASLQSQVAAAQTSGSDDGLKVAAKLLQSSSGIYGHLKNTVHASLQQEPTRDLQPDTLTVLAALTLAEAQEVIAHKAIADRMKDGIVAKLCSQCETLYATTLQLVSKESVNHLWDSEWVAKVPGKQAGFEALAHYYQSRVCNSQKAVGEEIARLKVAIEMFKAAQTKSCGYVMFPDELARCQQYYTDAMKDNDFIYHERVPDVKNLPAIGKAVVAKPTSLPHVLSTDFKDLFESLVPVVVQQALSQYDVRKQEIVNGEIGKLRESTQFLNSVLASLNLPAAIEDTSGEKLPQSLREKALAVGDKGGIKTLEKFLADLPELLTRNRELLEECERLLKEEKDSDNQLRNQFKERWTRSPSDKLTTSFQTNADKYRKVIETAVHADATIREKFGSHGEGMTLLSQGPEAIASSLPSVTASSANASSPAVVKLRQLMESVEVVKAERDVIESEFKNSTVDMKTTFLFALAEDGAINEPALSVESLGRVFGPLQKQVQESLGQQGSLVSDIQKAHLQFSGAASGSGSDRETLLKKLASAHDAFIELHGNLREGTKFYNDLTQLLVNFQTKISDFCFARKTEKEELMKDLTQGIANQNINPAPTPPTHHKEVTTPSAQAPPPRPPPPQQGVTAPVQPPVAPQQPYAGAPPILPYPINPQGMPTPQGYAYPAYPVYTPMPQVYNPYAPQPPVQPFAGYPATPYPQQPYPGYPYPQGQNPQWQQPPSS